MKKLIILIVWLVLPGSAAYCQTLHAGEPLFVLKNQKFDISGLQFTRDGRHLLTGSVDATIDFWNMQTGRMDREIKVSK